MSKKIELLEWLLTKGTVKTHEVIEWGYRNYSNRADRDKRILAERGLIRKLSEWEKKIRGIETKEAVYEVNRKAASVYLQPSLFKEE